jgi:transposase
MVRQNAGVDVSAQWFDVCVLVRAKLFRARFCQGEQGFEALGRWLQESGLGKLWVSLEHTGGYELKLARWLLERGHKVSLVDPAQALRFKGSLGLRAKTDRGDAYALARLTKERKPALWTPRPDPYRRLLELVRHRDTLVAALIQWKNRRAAPKANEFVHAQQQTLIEILQLQLRQAEQAIDELVASDEGIARDVALIESIKGLKRLSAVAFLAEAGPVAGYPTPESLALAAGLSPLPWQSGKVSKTQRRPYGNLRLRQSIAMAASVARRWNPAFSHFAARIASRGGKAEALLNKAVRRKLCHVIWGMLKNQEPFDPSKAVKGFSTDT